MMPNRHLSGAIVPVSLQQETPFIDYAFRRQITTAMWMYYYTQHMSDSTNVLFILFIYYTNAKQLKNKS